MIFCKNNLNIDKKHNGFTIVELLVVIVVIGILAAITTVSYSGIVNRTNIAAIQSELSSASRQLSIYYVLNGFYPSSLDSNGCPSAPVIDTANCIKFSNGATYEYVYKTESTYDLIATKGALNYKISENSNPVAYVDPNFTTIGSQKWMKYNLNVGTMIASASNQTNNAVIEKYCYGNNPANCTTYGAYYQWDEAMQYSTTEGAQGICPAGSHIPTDNDWKLLEISLGMTQVQADATSWRGVDQGTSLKEGGLSGMEVKLAGYRNTSGDTDYLGVHGFLWSSTESTTNGWYRYITSAQNGISRGTNSKINGYAIRCVK